MARSLTPEEFTFQSFRHSQGDMGAQIGIFRYFKLSFGISPNLHPTADEFKKYVQYIGHKSAKTHIQYSAEKSNSQTAEHEVFEAFKTLRSYTKPNDKRFGRRVTSWSLPRTIDYITDTLLGQEIRILDPAVPWVNTKTNKPGDRPSRVDKRMSIGQDSFLHYYINDGHSTGTAEFDAMYSDLSSRMAELEMVASFGKPAKSTGQVPLIEQHRLILQDARYAWLGRHALSEE